MYRPMRTNSLMVSLLAVLCCVVTLTAASKFPTTGRSSARFICQSTCEYDNCAEGHALAYNNVAGDYVNAPHACLIGSCTVHTPCHLEFAYATPSAFREAAAFIQVASSRDLQRFIAANARQMSVNEARQAVQITGCGGDIVAVVALSDDQFQGLNPERAVR